MLLLYSKYDSRSNFIYFNIKKYYFHHPPLPSLSYSLSNTSENIQKYKITLCYVSQYTSRQSLSCLNIIIEYIFTSTHALPQISYSFIKGSSYH